MREFGMVIPEGDFILDPEKLRFYDTQTFEHDLFRDELKIHKRNGTLKEFAKRSLSSSDRGEMPDALSGHTRNPENGLFHTEEEHIERFHNTIDYLNEQDREQLEDALWLALLAHRNEYRKDEHGSPFSIHTIRIATRLANKYKMDWESLAAALLHDTAEDTWIGFDPDGEPDDDQAQQILSDLISPTVADNVISLTKARGRHIRKDLADNDTRLRLLYSLLSNPSAAIIKIYDRIDYFDDIDGIKDPLRILQKAYETEQFYIPLAELLGMHEEAEYLKSAVLKERAKQSPDFSAQLDMMRDQIDNLRSNGQIETSVDAIKEIIGCEQNCVLEAGLPHIYDIPDHEDSPHIYVTIALQNIPVDNQLQEWTLLASGLLNKIAANEQVEVIRELPYSESLRLIEQGEHRGIHLQIKLPNQENTVLLEVVPEHVAELDKINAAHLYDSADKSEQAKRAKNKAKKKHDVIKARFGQIYEAGTEESGWLINKLKPKLPFRHIGVIGIDHKENRQPWTMPAGSTAAMFSRSINPDQFLKTQIIIVNGQPVGLDYILSPGDEIHIKRGSKERWDPRWLHAVERESDVFAVVSDQIKEILSTPDDHSDRQRIEVRENARAEIFKTAMERLSKELPIDAGRLFIGPGKILSKINELEPDKFNFSSEEEILLAIGLREVDDATIKKIAQLIKPVNDQVIVMELEFGKNKPGQIQQTVRDLADGNVNLLALEAGSTGEVSSHIRLYLDPDDDQAAKDLQGRLQGDFTISQILNLRSIYMRRNNPKKEGSE